MDTNKNLPQEYIDYTDNLFVFNYQQKEVTTNLINTLKKFQTLIVQDPLLKDIGTEISIAGGAIRDLVLNKTDTIKDIDIFISPNLLPLSNDYDETNRTMKKIKDRCLNLNLSNHQEINIKTDSQLYFMLLSHVVSQSYKINQKFDNDVDVNNVNADNSEYEDCGINGVLKITDKSSKYDIDVIFVTNRLDDFISKSFDYGICKAQLKINKILPHEYSYLKEYNDNTDTCQFLLDNEFIENIIKKEITYDVTDLLAKTIESSLFKHLGKVYAKFPDHHIKLIGSNDEHNKMLDNAITYHKLNNLSKTNTQHKTETRKTKI